MSPRAGEFGLRPESMAEMGPPGEVPSKEEEQLGQRLGGRRGHGTLGQLEVARPGCSPGICQDTVVDPVGKA